MLETILSDENLQLVTGQIFVGHGVLLCHKLKIFDLLSQGPKSIEEISSELNLAIRSSQALVSCAASLKLIDCKHERYTLSELGLSYLDKNGASYYGGVLDELITQNDIMNFSTIEKAILNNKSQVGQGKDLFDQSSEIGNSESFVTALHQKALAPAFAWTKKLPMKANSKLFDLGGGSGIHSIAACIRNPTLTATICERSPVIKFTQKYIDDYSLTDRIQAIELDLWKDEYPHGDIFFLGDIFHDWPLSKCQIIAEKCFSKLGSGGKIMLHEMLFDDTKTGPLLTAGYNMKMMLWTEGQQFTFEELKNVLTSVGFKSITKHPTLGNWHIIQGFKQ